EVREAVVGDLVGVEVEVRSLVHEQHDRGEPEPDPHGGKRYQKQGLRGGCDAHRDAHGEVSTEDQRPTPEQVEPGACVAGRQGASILGERPAVAVADTGERWRAGERGPLARTRSHGVRRSEAGAAPARPGRGISCTSHGLREKADTTRVWSRQYCFAM